MAIGVAIGLPLNGYHTPELWSHFYNRELNLDLSRLGTALVTRWGAATDAGPVRRRNEDSWLAEPPLYAVADGMGGHADGAAASAAALHRLAAGMRPGAVAGARADLVDLDRAIASAAADVAVLADPASPLTAPGTTLTGALALDPPDGSHWHILFSNLLFIPDEFLFS